MGALVYIIEIGDNDSFGNKLAIWTVGERAGNTFLDSPQDLPPIKQLFWHVRATDPTNAGPWSATQVFQTPAPVVLPPPLPPDVPIGPTPGDALNLGSAAAYNSPPDIASWPATAKITRIDMSPGAGTESRVHDKSQLAGLHAGGVGRPAPVHRVGGCEHQRQMVYIRFHPDVARTRGHRGSHPV